MRIYVYVGIFVHIHFVYICIYVFACMYVSENIYMHICMYIPYTTSTTATQVQRWCTGQASLSQVFLQSTVWVERLLQEVTFLWHLVRGNCVWGAFLTLNSPLSHPSSATSLYFGHKYFAKITKLPCSGRGSVHLPESPLTIRLRRDYSIRWQHQRVEDLPGEC